MQKYRYIYEITYEYSHILTGHIDATPNEITDYNSIKQLIAEQSSGNIKILHITKITNFIFVGPLTPFNTSMYIDNL